MKYEFKVPGIMCNGCVRTVTETLKNVEGVTNVEVSLESKLATVETSKEIELDVFKKALLKVGFRLEN